MHKFLIHKRGDHVGVATADIVAGERVTGVYMDDDSLIEVTANQAIPLEHKIAAAAVAKETWFQRLVGRRRQRRQRQIVMMLSTPLLQRMSLY